MTLAIVSALPDELAALKTQHNAAALALFDEGKVTEGEQRWEAALAAEAGLREEHARFLAREPPQLTATDRAAIYEGNARRVYPRLDAALKAKGK